MNIMKAQYINVKSVRAAIRTANCKNGFSVLMQFGCAMATQSPDRTAYNKRRTF
jgi:hypothetical protein